MQPPSKYAPLFEPIRLGPKVLKNRFYQVPHCTGFGSDKPLSQARFRELKAEGGWGAVCTEYCSIHPESDDTPWVSAKIWDEGDVANLRAMVEAVHRHDALAGIQLWYGGIHPWNLETRLVGLGPTQVASDRAPQAYPKEASLEDIQRLQSYYVAAAQRGRDAGFDIVYVYGAHGEGPSQFLEQFYNQRTDAYGGSVRNRARHWYETVVKVRGAVGADCAVAVRLAADSFTGARGLQLERDVLPLVELCEDVVDLWDVSIGGHEWGEDATPSRFYPSGRHLEWQRQIKQATRKPVVGVGRFTSPDLMLHAIRTGQLDIIGAARPSIADPFLPEKIRTGRLDDIRECVGSNVCISRWNTGGPPIVCIQNATTGEEYRRGWHPERFDRAANADNDVLVVGAGPAGMETAIVLGKRGMRRVHLVDGERTPGGHLRWLTTLPGLGEWARLINWRTIQLQKLRNVELIPGTRLGAQAVLDYGAEIVVLATGSSWNRDGLNSATRAPIPGADATRANILTPEQLLEEHKPVPGETVVIIDCDGYFMGLSLAELLGAQGHRVTLVTPHATAGSFLEVTLEAPKLRRRLHELGATLRTERLPVRIEDAGVVTTWVLDERGTEEELHPADSVVLVTGRRSADTLYHEVRGQGPDRLLDAGITGVFRVGDCVAPRQIADAIFDGHRLGREIDTPDPSSPLPFKRERPLLERVPG